MGEGASELGREPQAGRAPASQREGDSVVQRPSPGFVFARVTQKLQQSDWPESNQAMSNCQAVCECPGCSDFSQSQSCRYGQDCHQLPPPPAYAADGWAWKVVMAPPPHPDGLQRTLHSFFPASLLSTRQSRTSEHPHWVPFDLTLYSFRAWGWVYPAFHLAPQPPKT